MFSNISIQTSLDKFLDFSSQFSSFFDETNVINIECKMIHWLNNIRGQSLSQALQWQDKKYNYCHISQCDSECKTAHYIQYSLYSRTFTYFVCVYTYFMVREEYFVSLRAK